MKRYTVLSFVFVSAFAFSGAASAKETTLTGKVGDAMCGAKHVMKGNDAGCTEACVKKGSDYALIVGDSVYTLKADDKQKAELGKLAGKTADIKGDLEGQTVKVESVKAGK